jgi:hypothetical protein
MKIEKGKRYKLQSFNDSEEPLSEIDHHENYWKLIGQYGTVLNFAEELNFPYKDRILFQFEIDVLNEGLECHNEQPNSLWILKSDLE